SPGNLPDNVWQWIFDPEGEPRMVLTRRHGRVALHRREPGEAGWKQMAEFDALDAPYIPRFIDGQGGLYVSAPEGPAGVSVLKRFDYETGRPTQVLVSTPGFDYRGTLLVETRGAWSAGGGGGFQTTSARGSPFASAAVGDWALGLHLLTDAESTVWFDARLAALQAEADKRFPGRVNLLACRRCGTREMVTLVVSWSDQEPGQYWLHSSATGQWRAIGARRSDIDARRMGTTSFERFKARDGLEIPVWITRPAGAAKAPRPAVLLVHGGPWMRGRSWQWNPMPQFLASRGYVVIEPEFRGSTGFGARHFRAGWKQWGQAMQDDLVDALAWAVREGHADGKRVCIAGGSYGGYAVLMGLARHGEQFRCGAARQRHRPAPVVQVAARFRRRFEDREYSYPLIGDPVADAACSMPTRRCCWPRASRRRSSSPTAARTRCRWCTASACATPSLPPAGRRSGWSTPTRHGWLKLETRLDFAKRLEGVPGPAPRPVAARWCMPVPGRVPRGEYDLQRIIAAAALMAPRMR
ncbi:MAG: prolyl oligopeptidase family serine peptidase, partial [Rubrivivax sp.]